MLARLPLCLTGRPRGPPPNPAGAGAPRYPPPLEPPPVSSVRLVQQLALLQARLSRGEVSFKAYKELHAECEAAAARAQR
jgi:hypothetical protein